MSESPFVPFYTSDFLAGTSGMTAAARGVYITLLCLMYEAEAPLPQSWDTLARRCGCTLPAFRRAVASLEDDGKLTASDAGIWSAKCDKHIAQRRERQRSAAAAAAKRWRKDEENQRPTDASASSAQCKPYPEPEPYPEPDKDIPSGAVQISDKPALRRDGGKPASGSRARATRLPDGWSPSPELTAFAGTLGIEGARLEQIVAEFRDYWRGEGGQRARKVDWGATFRNRLRTLAGAAGQQPRQSAPQQRGWLAPYQEFYEQAKARETAAAANGSAHDQEDWLS